MKLPIVKINLDICESFSSLLNLCGLGRIIVQFVSLDKSLKLLNTSFQFYFLKCHFSFSMWLLASIVIIILSSILDFYLTLRQRKTILKAQGPPEIYKSQFTDESFQKAKQYSIDKINFGIFSQIFEFITSIAQLFLLAPIWNFTAFFENEMIHSFIFMVFTDILSTIISLPLDYYADFVIEEKHGFNNSTIKLWVTDKIKSFLISTVLSAILIPILILIFNKSGPRFVIYAQICVVLLSLILNVIAPIFIIPLFTKLTPITEGPIFEALTSLCQKTNFNAKLIYEADDSKRSNHTNAMVFGICPKKIAVADTMITSSTPEKIAAVIAHEIGHDKGHHIWKQFLIGQFQLPPVLSLLYFIMTHDKPFIDFGFNDRPLIIGALLTQLIMLPVETLLQLPLNMLSRKMEREADKFSAEQGLPIGEALSDLARDNKIAIEPDELYSAFNNSHPTLSERIKFVNSIQQKYEKKNE